MPEQPPQIGVVFEMNKNAQTLILEQVKEIERWRKLADRMYAKIVKDYCWHCGHEITRNNTVNDLMTEYREACIDSGVRDA